MYLNLYTVLIVTIALESLTLTWDVFKYKMTFYDDNKFLRLTLTWDVFKFIFSLLFCAWYVCLTLTWDVFKSKLYHTLSQT